jgi:tRNA dimethylallyltransferase
VTGAAGPLLLLVGPTASGKKRVALEIAGRLAADLLALDSMKVYRGMDLGTDKAAAGRFALTDLVEPDQRFSVGAWVRAAQQEVAAIRARGRVPLFVGGTGLYLRALLRGLFEVPDVTAPVREAVAREIEESGVAAAHARLAAVDPAAAERLHPSDRRRIARALEIERQTGRPLTAWQQEATRLPIPGPCAVVGLRWSRPPLRERIEARVDRMLAAGLVEEVAALRAGGRIGPVAGLAIGYREVVAQLESGAPPVDVERLAQLRAAIVRDTWAFMRRQDNWFRQFPEIVWVEAEADPATTAQRVEAAFRAAAQLI